MSKKKHHHSRRNRRRGDGWSIGGVIHRVVHGLSDALGIGSCWIVTGFILGFVFVPLLTAIVFFATLYWVSYPDRVERQIRRYSASARRAAQRLSDAAFARHHRERVTEPDLDEPDLEEPPEPPEPRRPHPSPSELRERFEALDRRAKSIEEFVASEEYRLEREFKRIDDD